MTDTPCTALAPIALAALLLTLLPAAPARAQTPPTPDVGQILQQFRQPPEVPRPGPSVQVQPMPARDAARAGTLQVTLQAVEFHGNTALPAQTLQALVADALGRPADLPALQALADRVTRHYRDAGYPFARAFLPPQAIGDGRLRIEVVEGRYGRVRATAAKPGWEPTVHRHLAPLQAGDTIRAEPLERAVLLLGDLPGGTVVPVIEPGQAVGTGDLDVQVAAAPALTGAVALDNQGNRYSGRARLQGALDWNGAFGRLGDQLSLRALVSDGDLWLGSVAYGLALPAPGWRAQIGYAHTQYELGEDFAALDARGTARIASAGLSWAWLRSDKTNLRLSLQLQHKRLDDRQTGRSDRKSSTGATLQADFDHRDAGGLSFGSLGWTSGRLQLAPAARAADPYGTHGGFDRLNLDLSRLQTLSSAFTGYARLSAQWSPSNLDSSERLSLGGAEGVRAYPSGEGTGDRGWLVQLELRTALGGWEPYFFADHGGVQINAKPLASTGRNQRTIGGAGIGTRWRQGGWQLDASAAWSTRGGQAESDGGAGDDDPRLWVRAGYRF